MPEKEQLLSTPYYLTYVHPLKVTLCVISQSDDIAVLSCTHRKNYQGYHSIYCDIHAFLNLLIMESEGQVVAWTPWGGC